MPSITTFALAPTAVRFPPKSAPAARGPPQGLAVNGIGGGHGQIPTTGLIVATLRNVVDPGQDRRDEKVSPWLPAARCRRSPLRRVGRLADDSCLDQRADQDEQPCEEQGFPFNAVEIAFGFDAGDHDEGSRAEAGHDGRLNVDYRCAMKAANTMASTTARTGPADASRIASRSLSDITSGDTLRFNPERAAKDDRQ